MTVDKVIKMREGHRTAYSSLLFVCVLIPNMQIMLPPTGGRIIVASDGVWDAFDKMTRASSMSRSWPLEQAPSRMIQTIVRAYGGLKDDTTLVVIDITPPGVTFAQVAGKKGAVQQQRLGHHRQRQVAAGACALAAARRWKPAQSRA